MLCLLDNHTVECLDPPELETHIQCRRCSQRASRPPLHNNSHNWISTPSLSFPHRQTSKIMIMMLLLVTMTKHLSPSQLIEEKTCSYVPFSFAAATTLRKTKEKRQRIHTTSNPCAAIMANCLPSTTLSVSLVLLQNDVDTKQASCSPWVEEARQGLSPIHRIKWPLPTLLWTNINHRGLTFDWYHIQNRIIKPT